MDFRIASTFTDSLTKLTNTEQAAVKSTVYDLQANPANPGLQFHRLDKPKDVHFWSVRSNQDIRVIVHKLEQSILVCYVDHHDKAYKWAENRKLEVHPTTGAAQIVEVRETVKEIVVPKYVEVEQPRLPLFPKITDEELLRYGVPESWVADVKAVTSEDGLLALVDHLPDEAAEALLTLATGGKPDVPEPLPTGTNPFDHPDAQRRFRVMTDIEELKQALDEPWEEWAIFLHPAQRQFVTRDFNGPARVSGSAGTGKTVVALHRAVNLARRDPQAHVLLATFSSELAMMLRAKIGRLVGGDAKLAERIDVQFLDYVGRRLYDLQFGKKNIPVEQDTRETLANAASNVDGHSFTANFLYSEWNEVIDAWQIKEWEVYRDFARLGRKTRLAESKREVLWRIFEQARNELADRGFVTLSEMFGRLAEEMPDDNHRYDLAVIDEAQDLNPAQLRFLAALAGKRQNGLFFAGDLGQRIFQQAFSWRSLGVDVRGRSRTLKVNYRTSHQIRTRADRLLGQEFADVDGNIDVRQGTVSVFDGPQPGIEILGSHKDEIERVAEWLRDLFSKGIAPDEVGIFVRSKNELDRAQQAIEQSGASSSDLSHLLAKTSGSVSVGTMHLAKGLEFKAVVVMACDDEIIPSQERISSVADESDLREVYDTERQLLYVACTRARDFLLVTSGDVPSEFLSDLI
ncbi:MAG: DEAD/DEAH box helicase [Chloracidobacterium sp.]|nr:DEAD/DEAH box helicase [Chloracidobacterium sp.]